MGRGQPFRVYLDPAGAAIDERKEITHFYCGHWNRAYDTCHL